MENRRSEDAERIMGLEARAIEAETRAQNFDKLRSELCLLWLAVWTASEVCLLSSQIHRGSARECEFKTKQARNGIRAW